MAYFNTHDLIENYKDFTREELVAEYLTIKLANLVNVIGVDWHAMPVDVNKSPEYWKKIDGNLFEMHHEIARRYHITHDDCLWLENMVDSDNLYIFHYRFKPIVRDAIKLLEEAEAKKSDMGNEST